MVCSAFIFLTNPNFFSFVSAAQIPQRGSKYKQTIHYQRSFLAINCHIRDMEERWCYAFFSILFLAYTLFFLTYTIFFLLKNRTAATSRTKRISLCVSVVVGVKRREETATGGSQQITADHSSAPKKPRLVFTDLQRRTLQAIFKVGTPVHRNCKSANKSDRQKMEFLTP